MLLRQSRVGPVWSPYCELKYALRYMPVRILPRVTCRSALLRLEGHSQGWGVALGVLGSLGVAGSGLILTDAEEIDAPHVANTIQTVSLA